MAEILELVDLEALRKEVREKYRDVAEDPTAEYHFHTGRANAIRLGYPPTPLAGWETGIGGAGLIDIELANPLDTFAGARGEESAREFGTLGYSIRARRST